MPDYNAHDFDDDDLWGNCDEEEEEDKEEEEGVESLNDSSRDNHLQPCSMEEGSELV